jgi:hypothetical protein
MSGLNQRDRRELKRLVRRVQHAERSYISGLERVYSGVPPHMTDDVERELSLEPGALATWLDERERGRDAPVPLPIRLLMVELEVVDERRHNGNGNRGGS